MYLQIHFSPIDEVSFNENNSSLGSYGDAVESVKAFVLSEIRAYRNKLLAQSDWVNNPDVVMSDEIKAQWALYRQALRDFPATLDFSTPFYISDATFPASPQGELA